MNGERVEREYTAERKMFAERKNLGFARVEGYRRGEQAGIRKGIVMGILAGGAFVYLMMFIGRVVTF